MQVSLRTQIEVAGLPDPVEEYRFHQSRRWRFDYCWPERKVALELEGVVFNGAGGRHQRAAGYAKDCEKYNEAALAGWTVLRVTQQHVSSGQAVEWVRRALAEDS